MPLMKALLAMDKVTSSLYKKSGASARSSCTQQKQAVDNLVLQVDMVVAVIMFVTSA